MDERRRHARRHLIHYLNVYDRETGEVIGNLVDISPDGMRVLSKTSVEPDLVYPLRLELPVGAFGKKFLDIDAKSVWTNGGSGAGQREAGFRLLDIVKDDIDIIVDLMADFCSPDAP